MKKEYWVGFFFGGLISFVFLAVARIGIAFEIKALSVAGLVCAAAVFVFGIFMESSSFSVNGILERRLKISGFCDGCVVLMPVLILLFFILS